MIAELADRPESDSGRGEMVRRVRAFDWGLTALGPRAGWPQSLKTVVDLVLDSPLPMIVLWGSELIQIYNDGYAAVAAAKHPAALGQPTRQCWPEVWDFCAPIYRAVLRGEARSYTDQILTLERRGAPEEARFDLTFSPLRDDAGVVAGVLATVSETTERFRARESLRRSEQRLSVVLDHLPIGVGLFDQEGRWLLTNPPMRQLVGSYLPSLDPDGPTNWHGFDVDGRALDPYWFPGARALRGEVVPPSVDFLTRVAGEERWMRVGAAPLPSEGAVEEAVVVVQEVTDERRALEALRESERNLRTMANSIPQLAWMTDATGWIFWYNKRWFDYTGTTLEEMQGWGWRKVQHPDHLERVEARLRHSLSTGEPWEDTFPLRGRNGDFRWFLSRALPIRDDHGNILRWFGTNTDITERREAEEHRKLLIDELNHRVKNTLAIVQGLAQQTFRGSALAPETRAAFEGRLSALATAHNLLTRTQWEKATVGDVVQEAANGCGANSARIAAEGPPVLLGPKPAVTLAMALYELCTNAVKYGALSGDAGGVEIRWFRTDETKGGEPRFKLVWRETGGPPVSPPQRRGFGSRMIEQALAQEFGGEAELKFAPEGVVCTIDAPLPGRERKVA